MRVLVHCPNLIGDTVMATPSIRALRAGWPEARIDALIKPHVAATLGGNPWLDDVIVHDHRSRETSYRTSSVVRRLRERRYDVAVLLPNSFRSALLAWRIDAARRVGYDRGGRGLLLTDRLQAPKDPDGRFATIPAVEYYAAIVRHLGLPIPSLRLELCTTSEDEVAADAVWNRLGYRLGSLVVCLNTGGAFGPAKAWPVGHFAELARKLVQARPDLHVLALCGPSERDAARAIAITAGHPRVASLADQELSIGLSKACVRRSALLITTDSGPRHFAAAFGVPVVSLFGPTHIAWTRTYHPQAIHVQQPVPCGPCQRPVCPLGHHRCMIELTPDSVLAAATLLLRPSSRKNPILHGPHLAVGDPSAARPPLFDRA